MALVRSSLKLSETAKIGVSRGHDQQHIVRRAAGDMDDSDDIVVEENIPETLSPGNINSILRPQRYHPKHLIIAKTSSKKLDRTLLKMRMFLKCDGSEGEKVSILSDPQVKSKSIRTPPPPSEKRLSNSVKLQENNCRHTH